MRRLVCALSLCPSLILVLALRLGIEIKLHPPAARQHRERHDDHTNLALRTRNDALGLDNREVHAQLSSEDADDAFR
jgi:hypothetical protein